MIFLLIYLISLAIHIIDRYIVNRRRIFRVGDLIDLIEFYMWFPILNTLSILIFLLISLVIVIWERTKLNVLWNKFRNIKLK